MSKDIKKLFLGISIFLLIIFFADRCIGVLCSYCYDNCNYGIIHRQKYSLFESQDELLIIGSSRAAHHYIPQVFSDSLGCTCYNTGSDGQCIFYFYALLSSYIERDAAPKMVICEIGESDILDTGSSSSFSLAAATDCLAPYYGCYSGIDTLFREQGWKEKAKLLSKAYRYNSKLVQMIKCSYIPSAEDHGYEALVGVLPVNTSKEQQDPTTAPVSNQKIEYLIKFINLAHANNIELIFVQSPKYYSKGDKWQDSFIPIASKYGVTYLNYENDVRLMNPTYFKDLSHLNNNGAFLFSKLLVCDIMRLEKK